MRLSLTTDSYGLASEVTLLPHPADQRSSLLLVFRELALQGHLILGWASRLDAFSVYPVRAVVIRPWPVGANRYARGAFNSVLSY
jgi:hypothetical protein